MLVVNRTRGTGEIENPVDFNVQREADIVAQGFKVGITQEMNDVGTRAGKKIIHAQHLIAARQQSLTEV
jgi:hypothetical protein